MLIQFTCHAAYGSGATHMVTEEALAERKAALEGDPGTDNAVKVDMPQNPSMHQAQPVDQPDQPLETRVGTSCSCQRPHASIVVVLVKKKVFFFKFYKKNSTTDAHGLAGAQHCSDCCRQAVLPGRLDCCNVQQLSACAVIAAGKEQACSLHAD